MLQVPETVQKPWFRASLVLEWSCLTVAARIRDEHRNMVRGNQDKGLTKRERLMAKSSKNRSTRASSKSRRKGGLAQPEQQTKKQIALGRKEARQNRIIWLSVGGLALVVVLVLAIGLVQQFLVKPAQPVAMVNGAKVKTTDFQDALTYQRYNLHMNLNNLQRTLNTIDPDAEGNEFLVTFYEQQLQQLQSNIALAPQQTLDQLIDDVLIEDKAAELGIAVTEDDVTQAIDDDLRQAAAPSVTEPITSTEELPTATPVPQEQLDSILQNALANMGLSEKAFRTLVKRSLYREKVQEALASEVETTGLVVHVLLLETENQEASTEAMEQLRDGEDFAKVVADLSIDPQAEETGGDIGWVTTGQLSGRYGTELEELVFSLEPGEMGNVESNERFFVTKVLERDENGPLPDEVVSASQNSALIDWLTEQKSSPETEIERMLDPDQIPADPFALTTTQ